MPQKKQKQNDRGPFVSQRWGNSPLQPDFPAEPEGQCPGQLKKLSGFLNRYRLTAEGVGSRIPSVEKITLKTVQGFPALLLTEMRPVI
jgi:hypothetical protein